MVKRKESTNSGRSIGYYDNSNRDNDDRDEDEDEDVIAQRISAWGLLPSLNMSKI